ncbi:MAG: FAD-binding protein [Clostridiales bacterium]|nr:FAD-binding protein [Clostridiales bacterium]
MYDADVVVIGGGTSGSAAAARAAQQGANVVLIEKSGRLGGTGTLSSEPMTFGAQIQLDAGVTFDVGATFEDWMSQNHWSVNGHLVSQFLNISGQVGDWLIENGFHFIPGTTTDTTLAYRDHSIGTMTQKESFEELCKDVDTILYETTGKSLIVKDGQVVGVEAERYDGTQITVNAKAVIVATGGFGGSEELMTKYNGGYFKLLGLEQNVGEGLLMMTEVGAQEYHVGGACAHQTEVPVQVSGFSAEDTAIPYTITNLPVLMRVSKTGQRFMDEDEKVNSPTASSNYVSSNGPEFFTLLTQSQLEILRDQGSVGLGMDKEADPSFYTFPVPSNMPMTNIEEVLEAACDIGMAYKADTLEELAEVTGMDIEILRRNVEDYNAACEAGQDNLFYKNPAYLYPYDQTGPFYAVVGCVMSYNSLGGVKVDELMRVADTQDQPIPGLYAAGVDSIGTVLDGVSYPNLFGVALGWGFSSGYMAGESAAAYALQ